MCFSSFSVVTALPTASTQGWEGRCGCRAEPLLEESGQTKPFQVLLQALAVQFHPQPEDDPATQGRLQGTLLL